MKKFINSALIATIILISVDSCAVRKSQPITGKLVDQNNASVKHGQVLYNMHCQKCHPAGEAGLGPGVTSKPGFAKKFQVRHGVGAMPAYKQDHINKEDLNDIIAYLKDLNSL